VNANATNNGVELNVTKSLVQITVTVTVNAYKENAFASMDS